MDFNGIWKGEYITEWFTFSTGREVAVPFIMRINTKHNEDSSANGVKVLFDGICQDDPEIAKINFHANIAGSIDKPYLYLIKQYPKLLIRRNTEVEIHEGNHPEIIYKGEFRNKRFTGIWNMNRTFRTVDNELCELMPMKGSWWMEKI